MKNSKRLDYIDAAKGIGMMTVMWGHIHLGDISTDFVYAFHMPLFFILSGMVFFPEKYGSFKNFIARKARTLLVPYAIYSVVTWMIWAAYVEGTHQQVDSIWVPLLETVISRGSEGYLVHNVPLWFVTCLFITELTYYWISKLPDWINILIGVILAVSGYCLVTYAKFFDFSALPWSIEVMMMAMIFFAAGHLVVKRIGHVKIMEAVKERKGLFASIALLLFVGVCFVALYNGYPSMGHARLNNPVLFYPGAFFGSAAMIIVCAMLANSLTGNKLWDGVLWFGSNSFIAMAIHNPIKGFLVAIVAIIMGMTTGEVLHNVPLGIVIWIITFAITAIFMIFIVRFKKRLNKQKA